MKAKLHNTKLDRPFHIDSPSVVSRKLLTEIRPILDELRSINSNKEAGAYFMDHPEILNYMDAKGRLNPRKIKEIADEFNLDIAGQMTEIENILRAELMASFPGLTKAMGSYNISVDPYNDRTWELAIELIRKTAICSQAVDRELLDEEADAKSEFWDSQDVQQIKAYVDSFREYLSTGI